MKKIKLISTAITLLTIFSINTFAMKPTNNNNFNNAKINTNNDKDKNNKNTDNKDNNNAINANTINNKKQNNTNNIHLNTINNDNDSDNKNISNEEYQRAYEEYERAYRKNFHIPDDTAVCIMNYNKIGNTPIEKNTPFDDLEKDKINTFSSDRYDKNHMAITIFHGYNDRKDYHLVSPDENFKVKKYNFIKFWDDDFKTNENGLNNLTEIKEEKSKEEKEIKKEKSKKEEEKTKSYFVEKEYYENDDFSNSNKIKSITIYEKLDDINLIKKMSKLIFDKEGFLRLKFIYAPYHKNFKYKGEKKHLKYFQPKAFVAIYTKKFKPTNFDFKFYKDNIYLNSKDLRNATIYFNKDVMNLNPLDENDLDGEDSVEEYDENITYWFHKISLNYNDLEAIRDLSTLDYWDEFDPDMAHIKENYDFTYLKYAKAKLDQEIKFHNQKLEEKRLKEKNNI